MYMLILMTFCAAREALIKLKEILLMIRNFLQFRTFFFHFSKAVESSEKRCFCHMFAHFLGQIFELSRIVLRTGTACESKGGKKFIHKSALAHTFVSVFFLLATIITDFGNRTKEWKEIFESVKSFQRSQPEKRQHILASNHSLGPRSLSQPSFGVGNFPI